MFNNIFCEIQKYFFVKKLSTGGGAGGNEEPS